MANGQQGNDRHIAGKQEGSSRQVADTEQGLDGQFACHKLGPAVLLSLTYPCTAVPIPRGGSEKSAGHTCAYGTNGSWSSGGGARTVL